MYMCICVYDIVWMDGWMDEHWLSGVASCTLEGAVGMVLEGSWLLLQVAWLV